MSRPGVSSVEPDFSVDLVHASRDALIAELTRLREERASEGKRSRRLEEACLLRSECLLNMSHELRTPLNAIVGFAELMFKGKVGAIADDHREYLGDILDSSRDLLRLIDDVLDLARIESGTMVFRPQPMELAKVVASVRDILRGPASAQRIRMETGARAGAADGQPRSGKIQTGALQLPLRYPEADARAGARDNPRGARGARSLPHRDREHGAERSRTPGTARALGSSSANRSSRRRAGT